MSSSRLLLFVSDCQIVQELNQLTAPAAFVIGVFIAAFVYIITRKW